MRHHYSNNGTHAVARCKEEIGNKKKTLIFCGVGSHHRNGKAENCIKIICNPARRILIHAMHMWPEIITQSLWSHSASLVVYFRNKCELNKNGLSLLDKLSTVKKSINLRNSHAFGFTYCVLQISYRIVIAHPTGLEVLESVLILVVLKIIPQMLLSY